ncbi:MAG: hypothetical protein AAF682_21035 [Planctomycetota bacterium]
MTAPTLRLAALALVLAPLGGCRATGPGPVPVAAAAAEDALVELYRAFCFDAGREPDWDAMRALFAEGAAFVAPIAPGATPRAVDATRFLADFRAYVRRPPYSETGLHERITHVRLDVYGAIAHAYVTFEGFVPGEAAARTRGVDSIQLVRAGERWLLASFTTQYEDEQHPLPARFGSQEA